MSSITNTFSHLHLYHTMLYVTSPSLLKFFVMAKEKRVISSILQNLSLIFNRQSSMSGRPPHMIKMHVSFIAWKTFPFTFHEKVRVAGGNLALK